MRIPDPATRLLLSLIIISSLATGCGGCDSPSKRKGSAPAAAPEITPQALRRDLVESYRLRPDRRFLLALSDLQHFLTGRREEAKAEFTGDGWRITLGDSPAGTLPEIPDFPDLMGLLKERALAASKEGKSPLLPSGEVPDLAIIEEELSRFLAPHAAVAARRADELWRGGSRHPAILASAARALVSLSVQSLDGLETADRFTAKALAVLALAEALAGEPCRREESLLAFQMGYTGHAAALAASLPETDAVRLYATRNDRLLEETARSSGGSVEARYLHLLRLADRREAEPFVLWIRRFFPDGWFYLPLFKAGLQLGSFSLTPALSQALPGLVLMDLAREAEILPDLAEIPRKMKRQGSEKEQIEAFLRNLEAALGGGTDTLTDRFESGLPILDRKYQGPFLDSETYREWYLGYYFSALYGLGLHYLDSLSSAEAAAAFASYLGHAESGLAADFQRWYRNLSASKSGKGDPAALVSDISGLTQFGAPPLMRTLDEQKAYFSFGDPGYLKAVKLAMPRLDTRPFHVGYLIDLAYSHLLDLNLLERLMRALVKAAPIDHQGSIAWYASFTGDDGRLLEMLRDPSAGSDAKIATVNFTARLKLTSPGEIREVYRQLLNDRPDYWPLREQCAEYLLGAGEYREARRVLKEWLDRDVPTGGLEPWVARSLIAEAWCKEKQWREAWEAVQPAIKSGMARPMERGALILEKMGRKEEALDLARAVLKRYPDSLRTRVFLAGIYWRAGMPGSAAEVLKAAPINISLADWSLKVGEEFVEDFKKRSKEEALGAFDALAAAQFGPFELQSMTVPVGRAGLNELAFEMASRLHYGGLGQLDLTLRAYTYLKKWKGKEEALRWLRQNVPVQMLNAAGMMIFREREYDLLWDLIQEPEKGQYPEFVWLMRAAASAAAGRDKDPHRAELLTHYDISGRDLKQSALRVLPGDSGKKEDPYFVLGRFLLGLVSEEEVVSLATDPKKRCEISYYVGLRAQGEGRLPDASDWYRISIETGLINNGEYRWAHDQLFNWRNEGISLSRPRPVK